MRVLIVEDDAILGGFLEKLLRLQGYDVSLAGDGDAALRHMHTLHSDLVVLDLGLPRKDGIEVLAEMRESFPATAVLVLTGRAEQGQADGRARCLRLGADDIMVKPFSIGELTARCQAILRRRERYADPMLRFGDLVMDRVSRRVTQAGSDVQLTSTEFALLESLMRRNGECCSRAELMHEVWQAAPGHAAAAAEPAPEGASNGIPTGGTNGGTNILDVYINYLRRKLGQGAGRRDEIPGRSVVRTVRGQGYRLAVPGMDSALELGITPKAASPPRAEGRIANG